MASSSSRHKARGTDHQGLAGLPNTWSIERAPASSGPYLGINAIREPFTVVILYRKPVPFSDPARPHRTCRVIHCHFHHCHSCSRKRRKKKKTHNMSDVFRRIGRGGAGNFIPEKEIQDAARAKEAQVSPPLRGLQ